MAYLSKRTGKEVDELLDRVEQGGGGASITIDTELSATSNNAIANSAVTRELEKKMANTPSGDPMHYAFEAKGARWNANTGYWELNGLTNISSVEINSIYNESLASWTCAMEGLYAYSAQRTNFVGRTVSTAWGYLPNNSVWMFLEARNMEVVRISEEGKSLEITNALGMFFRANTLRNILGVIDFVSAIETSEMFKECYALEFVQCANLKSNISFSHSSLLSKESLLYMINNCASGVSFTITLHPEVFEKCSEEWLEDIDSALGAVEYDKLTNITLARA